MSDWGSSGESIKEGVAARWKQGAEGASSDEKGATTSIEGCQ